jgi:SAM-dependent methyltransferase
VRDLSQFPDDYFDEIIAHDVIEHLPRVDTRPALAGWARVLRQGGTLSLRTTSYLHLAEWLLDGYGEVGRHETAIHRGYGTQAVEGDFHLTSFTPLLLQHYLNEVGLVPQSTRLLQEWMIEVVAQKGAATGIDLHTTIGSRRDLVWRLAKRVVRDRLNQLLRRGT